MGNRYHDIGNDNRVFSVASDKSDVGTALEFGVIIDGSVESQSGAGAIDPDVFYTKVTTTGANALTLADGDIEGQLKLIHMIVDAGNGTLTPATFVDGTTVTFADAGDAVLLMWTASGWRLLADFNLADGATAPAVA